MLDNNENIISLNHVSKSYSGKKVLDDISFYVRKGEFVTLLGPSGCGKTTTLRLIAGFLSPDEGDILLDGKDISEIPPYKRPFNTVFQRYALFPHLDVYDNIAFGLKLQKLPLEEIDKRVRKVLKMVSMTDYEDRDVESLSGGQQQRVAIARAVISSPKLILADEPTGNLDSKNGKEVMELLQELNSEGTTIVMITHSQSDASCAHRTINLFDGAIVSDVQNEL